MKYFLTIAITCLCVTYLNAHPPGKPQLSPLTMIYLDQTRKLGNQLPDNGNYVYKTDAAGNNYISALIKVGDNPDVAAFATLGVKTGTRAGSVWTVQIPVDRIADFAQMSGIEYIQLDEPIFSAMDSVRKVTRVDSVHAGLGALTMPYTGKDVVVGIIDAGFDYRHPAFFDTTGASYRVRKIWEQQKTGTPPAGFSYGNEITDTLDMWSAGYDALISHGSHVAGIAAGSGVGSVSGSSQFRGIAYDADLVFVGITPSPSNWTSTGMTDIIDAMNYIYTYAASVGKPAVANLSWGSSIGPHDGLSLFSQACDNLTGPGKIFVCSAGNSGEDKLHLQKQFSATDSTIRSFVNFDPGLTQKRTWIDIWGDSAKNFCVQLSLYQVFTRIDSTGFICLDGQLHNVQMIGSNGDTLFAGITGVAADFNGKPRAFLEIYSKVADKVLVSVKAYDGKVNIWNGYVKNSTGYSGDFVTGGLPFTTAGNTNMTISDMSACKSAICVAAYASKNSFMNVSGGTVDYSFYVANGDKAPFSSFGPTADGRMKPDISGSGLIVGSAINSFDPSFQSAGTEYGSVVRLYTDPQNSKEYSYAMLMGTSMSSPAVSGIVALMLEANPSLTPADVQSIIAQTAILDNFTTNLPQVGNSAWGHGKINAMGAVEKAAVFTSAGNVSSRGDAGLMVYPNPASQKIYIAYDSEQGGQVGMDICDMTGRICISDKFTVRTGFNHYEVNTSALVKGIYYVMLHTGPLRHISKLIIE